MEIDRNRMRLVGDETVDVLGVPSQVNEDYTMAALIRAFAFKYSDLATLPQDKMIEKTKKLNIFYGRVRDPEDCKRFFSNTYESMLSIIECIGCFDDASKLAFDEWEDKFTINGKIFPIDQYLSQFANTKVYRCEKEERLIFLVDRRVNNTWIQAVESSIYRLLSWYFPSDVDEKDVKFFVSIAVDNKSVSEEKKSDLFVKYVNDAADLYDFKTAKLHLLLDGLQEKKRVSRIRDIKDKINSIEEDIKQYSDALGSQYRKLSNATSDLYLLENSEVSEDNRLFEFFNSHKQLELEWVDDDTLKYNVRDTLEFYDEDILSHCLENSCSYINSFSPKIVNGIKELFLNHKGLIKVSSPFKLDGFNLVRPVSREIVDDVSMPNPHLFFYGCSGENETYYNQYASEGAWDLAIEQSIAATKNINFADSVVGEKAIKWLRDNNTKCIYVKPGLEPISPDDNLEDGMQLVSFKKFLTMVESK